MNPRLPAMAALCREIAIPASVLAWSAAGGSAGINNAGAAPLVDRPAFSITADATFADELPPIALGAADAETCRRTGDGGSSRPTRRRRRMSRNRSLQPRRRFIGNAAAGNTTGAGSQNEHGDSGT